MPGLAEDREKEMTETVRGGEGTEGIWRDYPWIRIAGKHPVGDQSYCMWMTTEAWLDQLDYYYEREIEDVILDLEDLGFEVPDEMAEMCRTESRVAFYARYPYLSPGGVCCFHAGSWQDDDLEEGLRAWALECAEDLYKYGRLGPDARGGLALRPAWEGSEARVWLVSGYEVAEDIGEAALSVGWEAYVVAERALDVTDAAKRVLARLGPDALDLLKPPPGQDSGGGRSEA